MASNLLKLEVEVKLEIFDKLPVKDVQRLRRVCKGLKEVVDTNRTKIANVKIERERNRIVSHLNYYVFYTDNPSFMEKLSRCFDIRGLWRCADCFSSLSRSVFTHVIQRPLSDAIWTDDWLGYVKGLVATDRAWYASRGQSADRARTIEFLTVVLKEIRAARGKRSELTWNSSDNSAIRSRKKHLGSFSANVMRRANTTRRPSPNCHCQV